MILGAHMNNILFVTKVKILFFLNDHTVPPIIMTIKPKQLNYSRQVLHLRWTNSELSIAGGGNTLQDKKKGRSNAHLLSCAGRSFRNFSVLVFWFRQGMKINVLLFLNELTCQKWHMSPGGLESPAQRCTAGWLLAGLSLPGWSGQQKPDYMLFHKMQHPEP